MFQIKVNFRCLQQRQRGKLREFCENVDNKTAQLIVFWDMYPSRRNLTPNFEKHGQNVGFKNINIR